MVVMVVYGLEEPAWVGERGLDNKKDRRTKPRWLDSPPDYRMQLSYPLYGTTVNSFEFGGHPNPDHHPIRTTTATQIRGPPVTGGPELQLRDTGASCRIHHSLGDGCLASAAGHVLGRGMRPSSPPCAPLLVHSIPSTPKVRSLL